MRFNVISYLLKEGIRNVFKNKKSTISCLMIMCATMLIFGLFLVIGENINAFVKSVADAQGIMVYLKTGATDEEIEQAKEKYPELPIEGEIQFDAAVSPRVARTKCKDSQVAGHANTFVFPDINAGNIGYKIAQRLGNFEAYGPILLGLNAPINDLSRGCNASEVYSMAIITAALA